MKTQCIFAIAATLLLRPGAAFNLENPNAKVGNHAPPQPQQRSNALSGPETLGMARGGNLTAATDFGVPHVDVAMLARRKSSGPGARTFARAIFTKQDAPLRFHAGSSAIFTFGGGAWLFWTFASLLGIVDSAANDGMVGINRLELDVIFASSWGLIVSGLFYMPKSRRYEHYRRTFVATSAIMGADTMLWYWFALANVGILHEARSLLSLATCFAYGLALVGEAQFVLNDDNNRQEALDTDLITPAIAAPIWKYVAIAPTHVTTAFLKTVGMYHVLLGGAPWLAEHRQAAAFGSVMYMSNVILAAWSAFTQGTMTLRRAPAFGKKVFRLENDVVTWSLFAAVFSPLILTGAVGYSTESLQEYFAL